MRVRTILVVVLISGGWLPQLGWSQANTERGAVLGGITGGLLGAGIGKHNDETAAGALIGGAVGVMTGAALGNSVDREQQQAWARQQYWQQQQRQQASRAVSLQDVISMSQSGIGPDVMVNQIRQYGVQRAPSVQDVIVMHRAGVDDLVIAAMQDAANATPPIATTVRPPVVVEQYHYVAPAPYWGYRYGPPRPVYYHHHHRPPHVSWGISVRH